MQPKDINVELVAATRPNIDTEQSLGLATFIIDVSLSTWVHLLTHRRLSRNASSGRAMGPQRYSDMGYYLPEHWYEQGEGMQAGELIYDPILNSQFNASYKAVMTFATDVANDMRELGAAKEQCNRVLPQIKMIRGICTGTEDAWKAFLTLRNNANADTATQKLARMIQGELIAANWKYSDSHTPFLEHTNEYKEGHGAPIITNTDLESAFARIARVSYNREKGKNDKELHDRLLADGHYSVFEHMATWKYNPLMSNLTCRRGDVYMVNTTDDPYLVERWYKQDYEGWQSYRSTLEV